MTKGDQSPATKKDIRLLMQRMASYYDKTEKRMEQWKNETKRHFDVVAEHMRHDLTWAHREEILMLKEAKEIHGRRISALERHTGLLAA